MTLLEPVFFETDGDSIVNDMVADYEARTGKKLAPGQAERLLINAMAYREQIVRVAGNEAAKKMLLAYAVYPELDYLGEWLGVTRLPGTSAECTLSFSLTPGHPSVILPEGIRVQSTDGKVVFTTMIEMTVQASDNNVSVPAVCQTAGTDGNGYKAGDIALILDPKPYVMAVSNTGATAGGADEESDDALRERIRLAPSSFSVAGPIDAYRYFAKSAHPAIIDVAIASAIPGHVDIYPLLAGGVQPSQEVIDAVKAKCNPEKVRPMNDKVNVMAPGRIDYEIVVNLTTYENVVPTEIVSLVRKNLQAYVSYRQLHLGIDVVIDQIKAESMVEGVYSAAVQSPASNLIIDDTHFGNCTSITVNIVGESDH